jgi:hypothetical protein
MPSEPPLTEVEAAVLNVLMEHDRRPADRTIDVISDASQVWRQRDRSGAPGARATAPSARASRVDEGLGVQFWQTTHDAADAVE